MKTCKNGSTMKLLLIGFNLQEDSFPLGLASIKGYAQSRLEADIEVKEFPYGNRFSHNTNLSVEMKAISWILVKDPHVVGFSGYIWSIKIIKNVARAIRAIRPGIRLVLGGPEADGRALADFDFVIHGEGEFAFAELLEHLLGRRAIGEVRNLGWREGAKDHRNPDVPIEDLDALPFPYRLGGKKHFAVAKLETARGCAFPCAYCYYSNVPARAFSLPYLEKNIAYLFEHYEFPNLTILDANFNLDKARLRAILGMIERRKKGPLRVSMELKPEFIDPEVIAILESFSFVVWAELGLQSTDAQVLSKCGRPWNAEKAKEALRLLDASSIRYKIDLMYGLPGDTFFKFLSSAAFILAHARRQKKVVAHHAMILNNTAFAEGGPVRMDAADSSMVIRTETQNTLDLYKIKLFLRLLNSRGDGRPHPSPNPGSPVDAPVPPPSISP